MNGLPALQHRVRREDNARFHGGRRGPHTILGAVWHCTASRSMRPTLAYLNSGEKKASYHYVIDRDGTIVRFCPPELIAYHAGVRCTAGPESWRKGQSVNGRTLGVSFVNLNARGHHLTGAQLESGLWLGVTLQRVHGYEPQMNYAHREVAPSWKSDPIPEILDMDHWRELLAGNEWPSMLAAFPEPELTRCVT